LFMCVCACVSQNNMTAKMDSNHRDRFIQDLIFCQLKVKNHQHALRTVCHLRTAAAASSSSAKPIVASTSTPVKSNSKVDCDVSPEIKIIDFSDVIELHQVLDDKTIAVSPSQTLVTLDSSCPSFATVSSTGFSATLDTFTSSSFSNVPVEITEIMEELVQVLEMIAEDEAEANSAAAAAAGSCAPSASAAVAIASPIEVITTFARPSKMYTPTLSTIKEKEEAFSCSAPKILASASTRIKRVWKCAVSAHVSRIQVATSFHFPFSFVCLLFPLLLQRAQRTSTYGHLPLTLVLTDFFCAFF